MMRCCLPWLLLACKGSVCSCLASDVEGAVSTPLACDCCSGPGPRYLCQPLACNVLELRMHCGDQATHLPCTWPLSCLSSLQIAAHAALRRGHCLSSRSPARQQSSRGMQEHHCKTTSCTCGKGQQAQLRAQAAHGMHGCSCRCSEAPQSKAEAPLHSVPPQPQVLGKFIQVSTHKIPCRGCSVARSSASLFQGSATVRRLFLLSCAAHQA